METAARTTIQRLPLWVPHERYSEPPPEPARAPSYLVLWVRIALTGTAILVLIFGVYEIVERTLLVNTSPHTIAVLHIVRGMGAAIAIGTWAFYLAMKTRRYYDYWLHQSIDRLEGEVHDRTAALERSQAFTEQLFDTLKDRIVVTDSKGHVVKVNRVARQSVGPMRCPHPCDQAGPRCRQECRDYRTAADTRGFRGDAAHTGRIWAVDTYPVPSPNGHEDGLILEVARDVTDEKRLEALVLHQEKMASLGVLAAGIAHDIGNPLASLSSELEMLEFEDDPATSKESIHVLRTHVDRIDRALREMVDFARRRGEEEVGLVSVPTAIDDALRLVRHDPRMRRMSLEIHVPQDLPSVRIVEDHLVMVLVNLAINSLDAMPDGGTLGVSATAENGEVRITVSDTGIGMPAAVLARALDPMFTTKGTGTGLGLSVSQSALKAAGGRMHIASKQGEGCEVVISLPSGGTDG